MEEKCAIPKISFRLVFPSSVPCCSKLLFKGINKSGNFFCLDLLVLSYLGIYFLKTLKGCYSEINFFFKLGDTK